ncbi:DNA primase [Chondromyces crocatus]|uniref:DNA primase n=1 Tax=Chondromyces crocatus TaxID=52 RepID=A0A0K1EGU0_CHOCO|nr:DNA primase [Chondromyces crocatus]AKT39818.1 DNA primase [Chondromyces crocatus]
MISPETIALVKERTDLVALIGETVRLTRRGRSFTGLCPFHKEKSPSFHVNAERGFYHCFGCKESGSAVDFVMKIEGQTFAEAVRSLAERSGIEIVDTFTDAERREAQGARREKEDLYDVNRIAATFFEHQLRGGPSTPAHPLAHYASEELARRGLPLSSDGQAPDSIADALQAFRVGYAPYGWDGLASHLKRQGISPIQAERLGLLVPRSSGSGHYDRFRHRLMFAVTDVLGRVIAFSGRALPDPTPAELTAHRLSGPAATTDGAPAKYINSPESRIYTKGEHLFGLHQARHTIRQRGEAILVEGNFDVVALHARGITNAVAPLGTAYTTAQARLLKRFAPSVVLLFDGDAAGRKATRAARVPCREAGLTARVAALAPGLDPDDLARQKGPEAIQRLVKDARGLLEYLIDAALNGDDFSGASLPDQMARIKAVAALLAEEDDPNLRLMSKLYADRVSSKLIIGDRSPTDLLQLERIVDEALSQGPGARRSATASRRPPDHGGGFSEGPESYGPDPASAHGRNLSREDQIRLAILGAVIDCPEILADPEVVPALEVLEGDVALAVVAARRYFIPEKGLAADEFLAQISSAIHSFAAGRLAAPGFEGAAEAKTELLENARKLRRLTLKRANAAVVHQLEKGEAMGDVASEESMLREVQRRAREKLGLS